MTLRFSPCFIIKSLVLLNKNKTAKDSVFFFSFRLNAYGLLDFQEAKRLWPVKSQSIYLPLEAARFSWYRTFALNRSGDSRGSQMLGIKRKEDCLKVEYGIKISEGLK